MRDTTIPLASALVVLPAGPANAAARNDALSTYGALSTMRPGDVLRPRWSMYSPAEDFRLIMPTDRIKAPGYRPERALVKIRNGKLPQITLLPD